MQKISIVIPVYNTSKFLDGCLRSIRNQSFADFEVILVNDGSSDDSGIICERYANSDNRFRVLHQKNAGVTIARKNGVMVSRGEWVCFVDSDDTLPSEALQILYSRVNKNTDIIIGCLQKKDFIENVKSTRQYRSELILGKILPGPVAKLFRRELFDESVFDIPRKIVKGEDMLMNIRLSFKTEKEIVFINEKVYNYLCHSESSFHQFVTSIEYEDLFHQLRITSIPLKERHNYLNECVEIGLGVWNYFYGYSYRVPSSWKETYLYSQLRHDMKKTSYNYSFIDKMLLIISNPCLRFFLVGVKRLKNISKKIRNRFLIK
ncbi:glycosyltransferase family 2 protein [Bacteroides finegoldii]|jgi:hypothetical protein|uniref:glycosyltransferase family 2 protein n=1 Tax=Bacteroides finegoldii TaxID=338188 RepID=UPI0035618C4E